jgi:hypothetical protein
LKKWSLWKLHTNSPILLPLYMLFSFVDKHMLCPIRIQPFASWWYIIASLNGSSKGVFVKIIALHVRSTVCPCSCHRSEETNRASKCTQLG